MPKHIIAGLIASSMLAGLFFAVLTYVSGREFAWEQFQKYWYYLIILWIGFGIQVGLFSLLRVRKHSGESGKAVAASGVTSTLTMVACCTHYMVNLLPLVIFSGLIASISQFQVQIFWIGILVNLTATVYLIRKVRPDVNFSTLTGSFKL
ncbi:MAG: hypothetical protein UW69_C0086G0006 [Microgenomates group bacterium GW2011_GWA2_44_7]|nr:MAG: hypothetical protein UW69_C0086G0006 [Microgenomates group bacterium GW2011_GWA2_44_7]